ncbi:MULTISPECIES: DUF1203 domain-containing protein [unclassified Rhizobium]|uniref:DUF1203 domain-containing protein n=1 Tax=Rhizobium sp. PP-CC-3G-465 TaxID=2135648 RepID=UPI0010507F3A|nr:uncharacterized protein DUF1203 [Rhizobium sp. PP-CC-2G-626]TCQ28328.1 uncharacterized protein DUF1203 [Rhizobium sp. PP-CC-3G-465]
MTKIRFTAMPTDDAMHIWNGGADAYGLTPERFVSDGDGNPCRHCLEHIAGDEPALLFAYRAFPTPQAFAETGPIFLHAAPCTRYAAEECLPPILSSPDYIVRGYDHADRIVYGSGAVTPTTDIINRASDILERLDIAYVHVRSSRNNCYHCRIDRAA